MREITGKILSNNQIAKDIYEMVLSGDFSDIKTPGVFVNILLPQYFLRRPISVCDVTEDTLTLVYKVVGKGTEYMSHMKIDDSLSMLTNLGNGFDITKADKPLLVGGGLGVAPLYYLCKSLIKLDKKVSVILGFNGTNDSFYIDEFRKLGVLVHIATADGSIGKEGFVTNCLSDVDYDYFYTCGPMAMYKAMRKLMKTSGEYSFEQRMGCGFGACMGCSIKTKNGNKRICKEGPVLESEEIIWED